MDEATRIRVGMYRARGIAGSAQPSKSKKGENQVIVDLQLLNSEPPRRVSTTLSFSEKAAKWSLDRLEALGWQGGGEFDGIDRNEVDVSVSYRTVDGKEYLDVSIETGGRLVAKEPMSDPEKRDFMRQLNAMRGTAAAVAPAAAGGRDYPASWDQPAPSQGGPGAGKRLFG